MKAKEGQFGRNFLWPKEQYKKCIKKQENEEKNRRIHIKEKGIWMAVRKLQSVNVSKSADKAWILRKRNAKRKRLSNRVYNLEKYGQIA